MNDSLIRVLVWALFCLALTGRRVVLNSSEVLQAYKVHQLESVLL